MRLIKRIRAFLTKKPSPELETEDSAFGSIKFDRNGWVREIDFGSSTLLLYINADTLGPTDAQRELWVQSKSNLSRYDELASKIIRNECAEDLPTRELVLREIWIHPDEYHENEEMMLVYDNPCDSDGVYRASFRLGEVLHAGRDD